MKYTTPETKSLKVNAQTIICASEPTPAPYRAQIGTMSQTQGSW